MSDVWGRKTFCVITGASRGIGESIATHFAKKVAPGSLFVLIARSKRGLKNTADLISESVAQVLVDIAVQDLSEPDPKVYREILCKSLSNRNLKTTDFNVAIMVHNAGSLGPCKLVKHAEYPEEITHYFDMNVNSVICLNTQFLKLFPLSSLEIKRYVVNVTSILALQPAAKLSFYSAAKAAREMFMRVLAEEEKDLNVLQYSPGPVETDMAVTLRNEMGEKFAKQMSEHGYLSCDQTVSKLVYLLGSSLYKSGQHIDYYDIEYDNS